MRNANQLAAAIKSMAGIHPAAQIAEHTGYSESTVRRVASDLGVSLRMPRAQKLTAADQFLRRSA